MIIHGRNITMKTSYSDPEVMWYPWLGEGIFSFHFNLLSPSLSGCQGPGESSACGSSVCGSSTAKVAALILVMVTHEYYLAEKVGYISPTALSAT